FSSWSPPARTRSVGLKFNRGSPRSRASSWRLSIEPIRTGPTTAMRPRASRVRSLSPKPAKITAFRSEFVFKLRRKAYPAQQVSEMCVLTQWVEPWIDLECHHSRGVLLKRPFEPFQRAIVFPEPGADQSPRET